MRIPVICAIIIVLKTIFAKERGESCTTPNNEVAKCVPAKTCTIFYDAVKDNQPGITEFIQQSQCGYDTEPLVCCGTKGQITLLSRVLKAGALPKRTECGLSADEPRITGGNQTGRKEFPWMAALEYTDKTSGNVGIHCGGSVINRRYVLTAAHCIVHDTLKLTSVWLGDWKLSTDPDCEMFKTERVCNEPVQKFNIEKEIPHPFYKASNNQNDIALVRLAKDITYTEYIRPICLPNPESARPDISTRMTVAGWGLTETRDPADIKMKVNIPLLSNKVCREKLNKSITSSQSCAGGEYGKDSCQGDSGGPLMRFYRDSGSVEEQWYQEGIVSYGNGCGRPDVPAVYTRVSAYVHWIVDIVSVPFLPIEILQSKFGNNSNGRIYFPSGRDVDDK